jgi:hypothetical protein
LFRNACTGTGKLPRIVSTPRPVVRYAPVPAVAPLAGAQENLMSSTPRALCVALALAAAIALAGPVAAQDSVPTSLVAIYHVAPGKHLDFLKWQADREAIDREAGAPAAQWYAHMDGDSWDYVSISPDIDDALSDKIDEMARKRGLKVGPQAGLEFRSMINSHTDTFAAGPLTAAQLLDRVTKP